MLPISRTGATLTLAMADPTNVLAIDDVRFNTGCNVETVVATEAALAQALDKLLSAPRCAHSACRAERARCGVACTRRRVAGGHRGCGGAGGSRGDQRRCPRAAGARRPHHPAGQHRPHVGGAEAGERHPHRAVRARAPRPVPHRRHAARRHGAAGEVPRCDHLPPQDHGKARYRREAAAAGRPHQGAVCRRRRERGTSTSGCRRCPRCSARSWCCACSTAGR